MSRFLIHITEILTSRFVGKGAYTACMIATFIILLVIIKPQGEIGVLDRKDMDSFASIFTNYKKLVPCNDPEGGYDFLIDDSSVTERFFTFQRRLIC